MTADARRELFCFELIVEKVVRAGEEHRGLRFDAIRFRVADFERETVPLGAELLLEDREAEVSVGRSCFFFESADFLDTIKSESLHLELVSAGHAISSCSVFISDFTSEAEASVLQCRGAIQMYSSESFARTCQLVITARLLRVSTTSAALSARGAPSVPFRSTVSTSVAVQTSQKLKSRGVQAKTARKLCDQSTQVRKRAVHKDDVGCQTEAIAVTPKPSSSSASTQTDSSGTPKINPKDKRFLKRLIDHLTKEIIASILRKSRGQAPTDAVRNTKFGFNVVPRLQMIRTLDKSIDSKVKLEASLQKELQKIRRNTLNELFKLRRETLSTPPQSIPLPIPITRGPRATVATVKLQTDRVAKPESRSTSTSRSSKSRTATSSSSSSSSSASSASSSSQALSSLRSTSSGPSEQLQTARNASTSKTLTPPVRKHR